ncbi:MAG: fasciclin domain-containing protein [Ilumatobacteraceae bacterium]
MMVNDATVVTADVDASNGVIHVIDAVLVPLAG